MKANFHRSGDDVIGFDEHGYGGIRKQQLLQRCRIEFVTPAVDQGLLLSRRQYGGFGWGARLMWEGNGRKSTFSPRSKAKAFILA